MNKSRWNGLMGGLILLVGGIVAMLMASKGHAPSDETARAFAALMSIAGAIVLVVVWITRRPRATTLENL